MNHQMVPGITDSSQRGQDSPSYPSTWNRNKHHWMTLFLFFFISFFPERTVYCYDETGYYTGTGTCKQDTIQEQGMMNKNSTACVCAREFYRDIMWVVMDKNSTACDCAREFYRDILWSLIREEPNGMWFCHLGSTVRSTITKTPDSLLSSYYIWKRKLQHEYMFNKCLNNVVCVYISDLSAIKSFHLIIDIVFDYM